MLIRTICLASFLVLAAVAHGGSFYGDLTEVTAETFPRAQACGECHVAMYREWLESPHALAFACPSFREATDDYRFSDCLSCHAPTPTLQGSPPRVRGIFREEGVTCVTCHLEEGTIWGPHEHTGFSPPHPVGVAAERYRDARFCGRCHEGTFAEWKAAEMEKKPPCQQCHMPRVTRKMTVATSLIAKPFIAFEDEVPQGRHTFVSAPRDLDEPAFGIEAERRGTTVTLTIRNHVPHSLPTGDFGVRVVVVEARAIDGNGKATPLGRRELVKETGTEVPARSALIWKLPVSAQARELRLRMWRHGRAGADAIELIRTEVPLR